MNCAGMSTDNRCEVDCDWHEWRGKVDAIAGQLFS